MSDYGQFKLGNAIYPLDPASSNSLLQDVNAPLYYALDYFSAMIRQHLGARWDVAVLAAGLPEYDGYVVRTALPYDPTPELITSQVKLPLLAVWEDEGTEEQKTLSWYHTVSTWKATYVLPPMTAAQKELLHPFLKAAKNTIADRTIQGHDPSYLNNLVVWDVDVSGVEKIRLTKFKISDFQPSPLSNMFFPAVLMTFDVMVRQDSDPSFFEVADGVDITQQVEDLDLIQTKIDF